MNVIFPPSHRKQTKMDLWNNTDKYQLTIEDIANQLSSKKKIKAVESITGNTQISKTELENLFPISVGLQ